MQDETRLISDLGFGGAYIKYFTACLTESMDECHILS